MVLTGWTTGSIDLTLTLSLHTGRAFLVKWSLLPQIPQKLLSLRLATEHFDANERPLVSEVIERQD